MDAKLNQLVAKGSALDDVPSEAFRRHFESLPGAAYMWRREGSAYRMVAYNRAAARLPSGRIAAMGDEIDSELSRHLMSSFPEFFSRLERCLETETVFSEETEFVFRLTGAVQHLKFTFVPVSKNTVVVHTGDVTASKRDELEARAREARFVKAQQLANIGIWELDLVADKLTWSSEIYRIFEIDRARFCASYDAFLNTVHPEDRAKVDLAYTNSLRCREPYEVEHRLLMSDGSVKYVVERCETYYDADGNPLRSLGTVQDITERREAQNRIDELMQRLEALTNVAFDGVCVSRSGVIEEASGGLAEILGYRQEELVGMGVTDIVARPFRTLVEQRLVSPEAERFEFRALRKDRSTISVQGYGTNIEIGGKTLQITALRDISERTRLEREVVTISDRERQRIGHDLHENVCQLMFGAAMSLKTASIHMQQDGSKQLGLITDALSILDDAMNRARHLSRLLMPIGYGGVGLAGALSEMVSTIDKNSDINCSAICAYRDPISDPDLSVQLFRIAQESFSNALKYSGANNIQLNFYRDGELLHLEVLDDGRASLQDDEYIQIIGLDSLRHRARMIDGSLEVQTREGGGMSVHCICPL